MTCMSARKSSKFDQIPPPSGELDALEHLKKFPIALQWEKGVCTFPHDIHKSLDEFEIWPDPIMDHRVSCP